MAHKTQGMHPHHKGAGLPGFHKEHWQKDVADVEMSNGRYTEGEMSNPEHLKKSVDALSKYTKKHKMKYA